MARGADEWSELSKREELNPWTWVKLQACHHEAQQQDHQCRSVVQQILQKSTHFLRRIIVPMKGQGGVTLSYVCSECLLFPLNDYIWLVSEYLEVRGVPERLEAPEESLLGPTGLHGSPARRRFFGFMARRRVRARMSLALSSFW